MNRRRAKPLGGRGKWQVERERHRIATTEAPLQESAPVEIGEALAGIIKRIGLAPEHWISQLTEQWESVVGEDVAKHTRPGRMDRDTLIVFVDSSVWLNELARYGKDRMLKNISARFGAKRAKAVRFQLDPEGGR